MLKMAAMAALAVVGTLRCAAAVAAPDTVKADGAATRAAWVELAERLAVPILEPLAEGRLREALSVEAGTLELAPTWGRRDRRVVYLETFSRLMAGLAPWLALPDDGTAESAVRARLRALALKGCANAVDPDSPDNLQIALGGQTLVDAAYLAESFLRAWDALWLPLDETTKQRYIDAFTALRRHVPPYQNWVLFCSLEEAFLLRAGAPIDGYRLRTGLYKTEEWYVGDGWYADGPGFSFDYYNAYVIQPMYLECLDELVRAKCWLVPYVAADGRRRNAGERRGDALRRIQRYAVQLERFISPEGTYPAFGRSITYRMAVFQPLALLAWRKELPPELAEGQVRAALDAVRRRMFADDRNFGPGGFLALGFNGHQPEIADGYTHTGSLYMTTLFLLPLGLPPTDSFWTCPDADWTAKRAWAGAPFKKDGRSNINPQPLYWE